MAVDKRLGEIREGAGLEEARLNVEFIDFLRRWGTPIMCVVAAISLGYFFWNKYQARKETRIDEAYSQYHLTSATGSPSPDALRRIAQDYRDVPGVALLATLDAADEYLRAVRRGVRPGGQIGAGGALDNPEDELQEGDRERYLDEAATLYTEVHAKTIDSRARSLMALEALFGLAAVSETREKYDEARNTLEQARALADKHGFVEQAEVAAARINDLPSLSNKPRIYRQDELPEIEALKPPPETPAEAPVAGPDAPVADPPPEGAGPGEGVPPSDAPAPEQPAPEQSAPGGDAGGGGEGDTPVDDGSA